MSRALALCSYSFFLSHHYIAASVDVNNTIVISVSPPRSMSTACMQLFHARGDFTCINEPGVYCAKYDPSQRPVPYIIKQAQTSKVFVKEISSTEQHYFLATPEGSQLLKNNNVYTIILLRDPHDTIISLYRKTPYIFKPVFYEQLYNNIRHIVQHAAHKPIIIMSEDLCTKTQAAYQTLCNKLAIPYLPQALRWNNQEHDNVGTIWHNAHKTQSILQYWHSDVLASTQLHSPTRYHRTSDGQPTFIEIPEASRASVKEIYAACLPLYNKIKNDFAEYILLP